jgi:thiol-disulfide isomerase/thioredoxin
MIKNIEVKTVEDVNALNILTQKAKEGSNTDGLLVKFYADWCGHCQTMKEDWEKLTKELTHNYECKNPNATLTIVNIQVQSMDNNDEIMNNLKNIPKDINAVPVIMFVSKGKRGYEYNEKREYPEMLNWVISNNNFPIHKKSSSSNDDSKLKTRSSKTASRTASKTTRRSSTIKKIIKNARPRFKHYHRDTLRQMHKELRKHNNKVRNVTNRTKTPGNLNNIPAYLR